MTVLPAGEWTRSWDARSRDGATLGAEHIGASTHSRRAGTGLLLAKGGRVPARREGRVPGPELREVWDGDPGRFVAAAAPVGVVETG